MLAYVYRHSYLIPIIIIILLVFGSYALFQIPVEYLPQTEGQSITVQYTWSGQSPRTLESVITRKVEAAAASLKDVADISSQSREGIVSITLDFKKKTPVDLRVLELKELLASLQREFPQPVSNPQLSFNSEKEANSDAFENKPVLVYSLLVQEGRNMPKSWINRVVVQPLMRIQGVSDVVVRGIREPALQITVDVDRASDYKLSYNQILQRIRRGNQFETIGRPRTSKNIIYVKPDYINPSALRNLPVSTGSQLVRLSEVANITSTVSPRKSLMRMNGQRTVTLSIYKNKNTDEFNLAERVKSQMENLSNAYTDVFDLRIESDITGRLNQEMTVLQYQSLISAVIIFVILYFFIRSLLATFLVYSSILLSVLMGFTILYVTGFSVNMVTLATLIITLGLVVDNAIIVFDHLSGKKLSGKENSFLKTANEVQSLFNPILANTITTLIIFLPIALYFRDKLSLITTIGISLAIFLFSSVAICFTLVPFVTVRVPMNVRVKGIARKYYRSLFLFHQFKYKLRHILFTLLILGMGIPVFLLSYDTESTVGSVVKASEEWIGGITYQFYYQVRFGRQAVKPEETKSINLNIKLPPGSSIEYMDKVASVFEGVIVEDQRLIEFFKTRIDRNRGIDIQIVIPREEVSKAGPFFLFNKLSYLANKTGNADISVSFLDENREFGSNETSRSAYVVLKGYNYEELNRLALEVKALIENMGVARNIYAHAEDRESKFTMDLPVYRIKSNKLTEHGISYASFISAIKPYIQTGQTTGDIHFNKFRYLMVSESSANPETVEQLLDKPILMDDRLITLRQFGDISFESEPTAIVRENREYKKRVAFTYLGELARLNLLVDEIKKRINFPSGYSIETPTFSFGGEPVNPNNLVAIILLSILAIWVISSAALEHWWASGYTLICLLCTLAVCMAYTVWIQPNFSEAQYTAVLFTLGIAVNNMLLLLFVYRRKLSAGVGPFRAWQYAFQRKSRPVMMTLFTTIAGLVPLLVFDGSQFWYALAHMVMFTLPISTTFTFIFAGLFSGLKTN